MPTSIHNPTLIKLFCIRYETSILITKNALFEIIARLEQVAKENNPQKKLEPHSIQTVISEISTILTLSEEKSTKTKNQFHKIESENEKKESEEEKLSPDEILNFFLEISSHIREQFQKTLSRLQKENIDIKKIEKMLSTQIFSLDAIFTPVQLNRKNIHKSYAFELLEQEKAINQNIKTLNTMIKISDVLNFIDENSKDPFLPEDTAALISNIFACIHVFANTDQLFIQWYQNPNYGIPALAVCAIMAARKFSSLEPLPKDIYPLNSGFAKIFKELTENIKNDILAKDEPIIRGKNDCVSILAAIQNRIMWQVRNKASLQVTGNPLDTSTRPQTPPLFKL